MLTKNWKLASVALVLGVSLTAAAGCGKPASNAGQAEKKAPTVVTVATGVDVTTIDPQAQAARWDAIVGSNMFDGLLSRDANMKIAPHLAKSWKVSDDGKIITFSLRNDVKFQNGEPFDANVVKFSVDRLMNPNYKSQSKGPFGDLQDVTVVDPYTVSLIFKKPNAVILPYLTTQAGYLFMVPPKYIGEVGDAGFIKKPVGTGPYAFGEWIKDDRITMTANPSYFLGKPRVDQLIFKVIPVAATRVAALVNGEAQIVNGLTPDDQAKIDNSGMATTVSSPSTRRIYIGFRSDRKPFDDVRVRQAVNMAVDVPAIIKHVLGGNATQMSNPLISFEFGANKSIQPYQFNPDQAKKLLADAGYPTGFSVTLDTPNGRYMKDKEVAEAVAGYLAKVGIQVKTSVQEWAVYTTMEKDRKLDDLYLFGWGAGGMMDADLALQPFFSKTSSRPYSVILTDPVSEDLIVKARSEMDVNKRQATYEQAVQILHDNAVWLFMYNETNLYGVSKKIDWKPRADEVIAGFETSGK